MQLKPSRVVGDPAMNVTFSNNYASQRGGAVYADMTSSSLTYNQLLQYGYLGITDRLPCFIPDQQPRPDVTVRTCCLEPAGEFWCWGSTQKFIAIMFSFPRLRGLSANTPDTIK